MSRVKTMLSRTGSRLAITLQRVVTNHAKITTVGTSLKNSPLKNHFSRRLLTSFSSQHSQHEKGEQSQKKQQLPFTYYALAALTAALVSSAAAVVSAKSEKKEEASSCGCGDGNDRLSIDLLFDEQQSLDWNGSPVQFNEWAANQLSFFFTPV